MKFLLTSAWITNKSISNTLQDLVQKSINDTKLLFIITASNVEKWDKSWLIDELINLKKLWFKSIDITDISAVDKNIWKPKFEESDVLYFLWWSVFHLIKWINDSWLRNLLQDYLKTKVYVWSSSWSMVTTRNLDLKKFQLLYNENDYLIIDKKFEDNTEGLDFVDFQILPHYNDPYFNKIEKWYLNEMYKNSLEKIYVLDDNSALKIVDWKIEVVSEWEWIEIN